MDDLTPLLSGHLAFWNELTGDERARLVRAAVRRQVKRGTLLHGGAADCVGLLLVLTGQLRVYTLSGEGRELTLYRLFERDLCLLSASCMISSIQFDVMVSAEEDVDVVQIPPDVYRELMDGSLAVANYTNQLMASHFSDVMWLIDQIQNRRMDARIAELLIEERTLRGETRLTMTHEQIANHLGSAREVVTRMLRYFQSEGLVRLSRGSIELVDEKRLAAVAEGPARGA